MMLKKINLWFSKKKLEYYYTKLKKIDIKRQELEIYHEILKNK